MQFVAGLLGCATRQLEVQLLPFSPDQELL